MRTLLVFLITMTATILMTIIPDAESAADGIFLTSEETDQISRNISALLDRLLDPRIYDKYLRPGNGVHPTTVKINMHLKSLGPVSEDEKYYVLDCYFRQEWNDERLRFDFKGFESLAMNYKFLEKVWKPDTYFVNGKKSYMHKITVPNKLLRLKNDGTMLYSQRLTIKAVCPMRLKKFPLDKQKCPLEIASFGYPTADVMYQWRDGGVTFEEGVSLAQYEFINSTVTEGVSTSSAAEPKSACFVVFHLKRNTGFYLLQVYIPCCLIVCCSWVSFWIHKKDTPARVVIGVTTVLTITTMGFGGRAQMPKTSYATALDYFVVMCFSFVFASLIEYASINYLDFQAKRLADARKKTEEAGLVKDAAPNELNPNPIPEPPIFEPRPPPTTSRPWMSTTTMFPVLPPATEFATIRSRASRPIRARPPTPRHVLLSPAVAAVDTDVIERAPASAASSSDSSASSSSSCSGSMDIDATPCEHHGSEPSLRAQRFHAVPVPVAAPNKPVVAHAVAAAAAAAAAAPAPQPEKSSVIDIQARRFFPLAFIVLNSIYWLAYSYYITDVDEDEMDP